MTSTSRTSTRRWQDLDRRTALWLVAIVVLLLSVPFGLRALGANASATSSPTAGPASGPDSADTAATAGAEVASRDSAPAQAPAAGDSSASKGSVAPAGAVGSLSPMVAPKVARSAWLGVQVADLTVASAKARAVAASAGGQVTSENVVTGADPTGGPVAGRGAAQGEVAVAPMGVDEARLSLSVPANRLDGALTELARLGSVSYRSSQAEDVTDSYVDTQARIAPARASVSRVQALLSGAKDLKEVVLIESELTKRQADLDSLTQRMTQLDQQTTMSDVTVTLWTDATAPTASENGFVAGLGKAWDGLLGSLTVIVAGLATLLPWLVVLGLLAWLVLRLQGRRTASPSQAALPTPADPKA